MDHKKIFKYFSECVPNYADRTKLYIKNKSKGNSIRLKMTNGEEYVFTINGKKSWKFERVN